MGAVRLGTWAAANAVWVSLDILCYAQSLPGGGVVGVFELPRCRYCMSHVLCKNNNVVYLVPFK